VIIGKDFFIGLLFLLLGLLTPSSVYAQLNAKYFGDIYNENKVKIELLLIRYQGRIWFLGEIDLR